MALRGLFTMRKAKYYLPFILAALILLLLNSCITQNRRARICATCPIKETITDSVGQPKATYTPYDTLALIKRHRGDSISFIDCPDMVKQLKKNNDTITTIQDGIKEQITDGPKGIKFNCETDSLKELIGLLRKQLDIPHYHNVKEYVPVDCKKEHRTWLDTVSRYWLFICLGGLIVFLAIKFRKLVL